MIIRDLFALSNMDPLFKPDPVLWYKTSSSRQGGAGERRGVGRTLVLISLVHHRLTSRTEKLREEIEGKKIFHRN
ncbi:hypothetical protein OPV22_007697 [Ensete ventricosum]|uniref:Uncharacterized protein n=1 Tax=Ensete ventricosum TaxID=4639 RepID=A0AAV8RNE0_ENSVE|nr:hypothetical protein OPV22_007697 [Ensete ventricosum]